MSPTRPVHVARVSPGKNLFDEIGDPRFRVTSSPSPHDADAEFILIPYPEAVPRPEKYPSFEAYAAMLSPTLRRRAAEGRAVIVFDASAEGFEHSPERSQWLHEGLTSLGVPVSNCVYVTQERNHASDYARYCAEAGWTAPMTVLTYDLWIKRFHAQFEGPDGEIILAERLAKLKARGASRERRFLSLNLTARPTKVLFLLRLLKDGLWPSGFISFGGFDRRKPVGEKTARQFLKKEMQREPAFGGLVEELWPYLAELESKGRILLGRVREDQGGRILKTPVNDPQLDEYNRSWFSLVTESDMRERPSRITEKAFKPLSNLHPFLVLGNPGALKMIRGFGYQTFGQVFDESYDEEPDPVARFEMVYREFVRLARMDEAALAAELDRLSGCLEFNARHAIIEMPRVYREDIDPALLEALLEARRRAARAPAAALSRTA